MGTSDAITRARTAFQEMEWSRACAAFAEAEDPSTLAFGDLQQLVMACYLLGRDEESLALLERAHHRFLQDGDIPTAVRAAFWQGMILLVDRGDVARGGGWMARAQTLLEASGIDCVERGYLLVPAALQAIGQGSTAAALDLFSDAGAIATRFDDRDLTALSRLGRGQALCQLGQTAKGMALLDEAMLAVTTGEISPVISGIVYCGVIDMCSSTLDFRRAQQWTAALTRWCDAQAELVPFRGQCLVYRAEILQFRGAWPDALDEAERAGEQLAGDPAVGVAHYRQAELHRLRGEFAEAGKAYARANESGRTPEPGLSLLRLAQGRSRTAAAMSTRAMAEAHDPVTRANLLPAHVEIALAIGDVSAARAAVDELSGIAQERDLPVLHAIAMYARGSVSLAEAEPLAALDDLRPALATWQEVDVPHEAARTRVQIGRACHALGDQETAQLELDAAIAAFQKLGAARDLERALAIAHGAVVPPPGGLSPREREVLGLIAAGKTNRAIATELVISEKTVARHISNLFDKLDVSTRSAATAYAYEHQLVDSLSHREMGNLSDASSAPGK